MTWAWLAGGVVVAIVVARELARWRGGRWHDPGPGPEGDGDDRT